MALPMLVLLVVVIESKRHVKLSINDNFNDFDQVLLKKRECSSLSCKTVILVLRTRKYTSNFQIIYSGAVSGVGIFQNNFFAISFIYFYFY